MFLGLVSVCNYYTHAQTDRTGIALLTVCEMSYGRWGRGDDGGWWWGVHCSPMTACQIILICVYMYMMYIIIIIMYWVICDLLCVDL